MKRALLVLAVLMTVATGNAWAQGNADAEGQKTNDNDRKGFHLEVFSGPIFGVNNLLRSENFDELLFLFVGPLVNRTVVESDPKLYATFPLVDFTFARGSSEWKRCKSWTIGSAPCYKIEAADGEKRTEPKYYKPNWSFSGFGLGLVWGNNNGILQLRLPVVGRRIVNNLWLTTGVGIMPFAKENHFGFTIGVQSSVLPRP